MRSEKSLDELLGVEQFQIVDLLPHAREHDGDLQFAAQGEHEPALRGAIELGQDDFFLNLFWQPFCY